MTHVWADHLVSRGARIGGMLLVAAALLFLVASPAAAQKKKKNAAPPADNSPVLALPDDKQIDYTISEMLAAWQLGDAEKLRKDYADDVIVVNGIYAPPVMGFTNFLATYQQQRARMQRVRLDRANTYIKVDGNVAWVCYQWDFSATVEDQMSTAQGQTTLVLNKREGHWLIVLNHTSLVPSTAKAPEPPNPAKPDAQNPAKPSSR
jgi:uncharacterized protein (TIGR02246 family)